jgi:exonuclease VII large subunit
MSSLVIFCRDCGKQVPSSQTKDGLCVDCRVRRSVADLRDEHARLWRKRERYTTQNANVDQISRQIGRVEDRIAQRIRELVPNEREAVDHLRRELEAARGQRYTTQNANVDQIGRQIGRVEDRIAQRIRELVPNEREAVDHLRRELEAARGQRYTISRLPGPPRQAGRRS